MPNQYTEYRDRLDLLVRSIIESRNLQLMFGDEIVEHYKARDKGRNEMARVIVRFAKSLLDETDEVCSKTFAADSYRYPGGIV